MPDSSSIRAVLGITALFVVFALLLKLPSLSFEHHEGDEVIYWSVATNLHERGEYTLHGASVLDRVSRGIYDHPLFHHPPLYPVLLAPFVAAQAQNGAVLVSWLGHALCIIAVGLIGWVLLGELTPGRRTLLWLVLLGVATDPLLVHVSRKLWIDGLMTGLIALSLALAHVASVRQRRRRWLVAAGIVLGLAALAKVAALLAGVVAAVLILGGKGSRRERWTDLASYAAPAALLVLPWIAVFWSTYGTPLPTWLKPDEENLARFPFVAAMVGRPWYYYAAKLVLAQPVVVAGLVAAGWSLRAGITARRLAPLVWLFLFLAVSTWQGINGYGFQMRYIAPLVPAIYVLLYSIPCLTDEPRGRWTAPVLALLVTVGAMNGAVYLMTSRYAELLTIPELVDWIRF